MCRFPLFIIGMEHFSMSNSIPMSGLYIFMVCIGVSNSFSFIIINIYSFKSFSHQRFSMESQWLQVCSSLWDSSKYSGYSQQCYCFLLDSNCAPISKSSIPFTNHLGIVQCAPITIVINITFMFHSFLFSCNVLVFISLFVFFFSLCCLMRRQSLLSGRYWWQGSNLRA